MDIEKSLELEGIDSVEIKGVTISSLGDCLQLLHKGDEVLLHRDDFEAAFYAMSHFAAKAQENEPEDKSDDD